MNRLVSLLTFSLACSTNAGAACFREDPLVPPSAEMRVRIGDVPETISGFGESPEGMPHTPFPPQAPTDLKTQAEQRFFGSESLMVSYYEPVANNGYRICRTDFWRSRLEVFTADDNTSRYASGHQFSERLMKDNRSLGFSKTYAYDQKGRIERISQAIFKKGEVTTFRPEHCRRYDEKDRVVLWVNPSFTQKCPNGNPSPKDEWREYRYGAYAGADVQLRSRWHVAKNDHWSEVWSPFRTDAGPNAVRGSAHANSRRGVWEIFGSTYGKRDDNAANTVVDGFGRWNGSNYYFLNPPVSISILENPEELYQHRRRRITYIDGRIRLVELFQPGEHISPHRFYTLAGYVLRHEQLDSKGKIKRIITVNDWRQPRPGPKPDFDDQRLAKAARGPKLHQVYHRVYDIDENGRPSLVAVSWNRSVRNSLKATPLLQADLVFGTPDGKEKWKSRDEFDKAFDTSEDARQVFPDPPLMDEDD